MRKDLIANGEKYLRYAWPDLPATLFLEYAREGNRSRYEHEHFARRTALTNLIVAECVEGKGRFLDDIANGVWAICEESFWGVPAHVGAQKAGSGLPDPAEPVVDLFAAETGESLAWTSYLLGEQLDRVSPMIRKRISHEIDRRILTPCLERDDFGWMGFSGGRVNNWNPWCNSNWLACTLLIEPDENRRIAAVAKIVRSLDHFFDAYDDDGGCDEGPGYWGRAGGIAVRLPRTAPQRHERGHRRVRPAARQGDRPLHLSRPHRRRLLREFRRCIREGKPAGRARLPLRQADWR